MNPLLQRISQDINELLPAEPLTLAERSLVSAADPFDGERRRRDRAPGESSRRILPALAAS